MLKVFIVVIACFFMTSCETMKAYEYERMTERCWSHRGVTEFYKDFAQWWVKCGDGTRIDMTK